MFTKELNKEPKKKNAIWIILLLHIVLVFFSISGVFSKLAAGEKFLSVKFCFFYAAIIAILGIYAILWQQVIKHLKLSIAYANKAITVVWGMLWGRLIFGESITIWKAIGAVTVIVGVVIYSWEATDGQD